MYKKILQYMSTKPAVYEKSTAPFWDDPHVSKGMLEAHLAIDVEAASRKHEFIAHSVAWIQNNCLTQDGMCLLDLGCGPGIYAELFCKAGFTVTGIDFSKRSIEYALASAARQKLSIEYHYKNYLEIDFDNAFDIVTLIYCDFGVLSPSQRKILLSHIKKSLKANGKLILDGFTIHKMAEFAEGRTIQYHTSGFWAPYPYMCIQNNYWYAETSNYLEQYVIVSEDNCHCYNNWNQIFTIESLQNELTQAGFNNSIFYDDVSGKACTHKNQTLCAVAECIT